MRVNKIALTLALVQLLLGMAIFTGCKKEKKYRILTIPPRYISGNYFLNNSKGYRFPLPAYFWEYRQEKRFDAAFHGQNRSSMLIVESTVDFKKPTYKAYLERLTKTLRGEVVEIMHPEMESGYAPWVENNSQPVVAAKRAVKFACRLVGNKALKYKVERLGEMLVMSRGNRVYTLTYLAHPDDYEALRKDFIRIADSFELLN